MYTMSKIKLTAAKARVLQALFKNPLTTDSVNGLEDAYKEVLCAIGNSGRLTQQFMVDLDREFSAGLYTLVYRLSLYVDKDMYVDLGKIVDVVFLNNELRIKVNDSNDEFTLLLRPEAY